MKLFSDGELGAENKPYLSCTDTSLEYIYINFTKRELSELKDRQYAIGGLEQRLKDLYKSKTTYETVYRCLQSSAAFSGQAKGYRK